MCQNPECGEIMHAPDEAAGRQGHCPACGAVVQIPGKPAAEGEAEPSTIALEGEQDSDFVALEKTALHEFAEDEKDDDLLLAADEDAPGG